MYRYAKQVLFVLVAGILLATLIFVLLFTGVLSLSLFSGYHIAILIFAGLTLLLLLPLVLIFRKDHHMALARRYYGGLILAGAVGILFNSFLMFFLIALPVLLMAFIAINFFFLTLLLGGNVLLISAHLSICPGEGLHE